WFGLAVGMSAVATIVGNAVAPVVRQRVREEVMLVAALALCAAAGVGAAMMGGVGAGVLLAVAVNFSAAVGRLAFESIVQRDAPQANRGRAFARFETRFQLAWAIAGLIPVVIEIPGWVGFLVVGVVAAAALVNYVAGTRSSNLRLRRRRDRRPVPRP